MSERRQALRAAVAERLAAAAGDICALMERPSAGREEEPSRGENHRRTRRTRRTGTWPSLKQRIPETPQIKEEPEEQSIQQTEEQLPQVTIVCVKSEAHREEAQGEAVGSGPRSARLRALVTERLAAAAEEVFALVERTMAEYEEENQRNQQLLDEEHGEANPTEAAVSTVKQEICVDPQVHDAPLVRVKEEDPQGNDTAGVAMETHTSLYLHDHSYFTVVDKMEIIENWQIALSNDIEADGINRNHPTESKGVDILPILTENGDTQDQESAVVQKKERSKGPYCTICKKRFISYYELNKHKIGHSTPYRCTVCWKGFMKKRDVEIHLKKMHYNGVQEKPFSCSICAMGFVSNYTLRKHMYQHTGRRMFGCSLCDQSFKRKYELENHLFKHSSSSPVTCGGWIYKV